MVDLLLTSATAGLAVLKMRAQDEKIDLDDMWPDLLTFPITEYNPTVEEMAAQIYHDRRKAWDSEA
jgi:hypothetical protein